MSEPASAAWQLQDSAPLPWKTPALRGDLPDINIWLALAVQEHPHHAVARSYWQGTGQPASGAAPVQGGVPNGRNLWFCRVTMLGLVRLLCQPKVVGPGALALLQAWQLYRSFLAVPGVALLPEPAGVDAQLQALLQTGMQGGAVPPRLWTDAYLAATAQAGGLRLVTLDRDFERFGLANCLVLQP